MSEYLKSSKKNPFRQNAFILIPALLVIIYMFISGEISRNNFEKKILAHPAFSSGRITSYKSVYKQPGTATYMFSVNGNMIESFKSSGQFLKLGIKMYNHYFPVIYNVDDPGYNEILVFPNQFEEYGILYPDSLYWIKKLF